MTTSSASAEITVGVCLLNWSQTHKHGMMLVRAIAKLCMNPGSICEVRMRREVEAEIAHNARIIEFTDAEGTLPHTFEPPLWKGEGGYWLVERFVVEGDK